MPPIHVTDAEVEQFASGALSGSALLAFADHLSACDECRRRAGEEREAGMAELSLKESLEDWDGHVPEGDVHGFVDGRLDAARRDSVARHLDRCARCAAEVRDLQAFAASLAPASRGRARWVYGALAAAAAVVLIAGTMRLMRSDGRLGAASSDAPVVSDRGGRGAVELLARADRERVRAARAAGRLSLPAGLSGLSGRRGTLLGEASASGFQLTAPVGTAILELRPTLRWAALAGADHYVVTVQADGGGLFSSPALTGTAWVTDRPLQRGATYTWQVTATVKGREVLAPAPPAPPARFLVLDAVEAARLEGLPPSALVRGIVYAEAGLLDDAVSEFGAIEAGEPDAPLARTFLAQIEQARAPR